MNDIIKYDEKENSMLDIRKREQLISALKLADSCITKNYLSQLEEADIVPIEDRILNLKPNKVCRFFKILKLAYDKNENTNDKLSSVFNSVASFDSTVALIIDSDGTNVNFYMGIANAGDTNSIPVSYNTLKGAFEGNFPGSEIKNLDAESLNVLTKELFSNNNYSISSVSGIASLRSERSEKMNEYIQGIEKLFESMKNKPFAAVIIADSISNNKLNNVRAGYESLYSEIAPFEKSEFTFNANESYSVSSALTESVTDTVSKSVGLTNNYSTTITSSTSESISEGKSKIAGGKVGSVISAVAGIGGNILGGPWMGSTMSSLVSNTIGNESKTEGSSTSTGTNTTSGTADQTTNGDSKAKGISKGTTNSESQSKGRTLHISYENRSVRTLLETIDEQIKRLKLCEDFGLFNCAAYFIAGDSATSKIAANTYRALMRGENSSSESSHINSWCDKSSVFEINKYLEKICHPVFSFQNYADNMPLVTAGSLVSGRELPIHIGLPKKSLAGLPVMEFTEFSRNIIRYKSNDDKEKIEIGKIFHMGRTENNPVFLTVDDFTKHTFITGSTGSGKSNTLYILLSTLMEKGIKFMVVEPAKGEYKNVFGGRSDVNVVGTNPNFSLVLHINPFKFAEGIHVLEHLDRIIEMFNACWPMYAAMPAILKEAVEVAYRQTGWDLDESINYYETPKYPTFQDVLRILPQVIEETEYSQEVKGNYVGSLVTRVKTMTNGIYGHIFCEDETDNNLLFDNNIVVDLSRLGSVEAKSLIMGVLVMRLQEHRMVKSTDANQGLKHITVLEEAHHLLRRSSSGQSDEGANLQGKSVEMISNAIAEMRTYGEGFIIADQSPMLLDMSVIRNTNTKIILKLPDEEDRMLVGRAAGLSQDQIIELTKLQTGVAAINQSDWISPILCKIDEFPKTSEKRLVFKREIKSLNQMQKCDMGRVMNLVLNPRLREENKIDISDIEITKIVSSLRGINDSLRSQLLKMTEEYRTEKELSVWKKSEFDKLIYLIDSIYDSKKLMKSCSFKSDIDEWIELSNMYINSISKPTNEELNNEIIGCLIMKEAMQNSEMKKFYYKWFYRVKNN